ncbi:hypothetical protein TNCT_639091 [Trichonephila clavata]|uniref:Uncharacterized protein n=1 Tax=Trichonephila clavata TaxID=2740835 RepID=A0A8X6FCK3_TRICU|nr:hypothetical protein TNCT_639091 [Trichonephila clavata]
MSASKRARVFRVVKVGAAPTNRAAGAVKLRGKCIVVKIYACDVATQRKELPSRHSSLSVRRATFHATVVGPAMERVALYGLHRRVVGSNRFLVTATRKLTMGALVAWSPEQAGFRCPE